MKDNKGNYGRPKCLGWVKDIKNYEFLEVIYETIDNEREEFWFILNRETQQRRHRSRQTRYIDGIGKYKSFTGKVCPYAINYSQGVFLQANL